MFRMQMTIPPEDVASENERFMREVDRFVSHVTERLRGLDEEDACPERQAMVRERKALILQELERLDGMLADYRAAHPHQLVEALTALARAGRPQPANAA